MRWNTLRTPRINPIFALSASLSAPNPPKNKKDQPIIIDRSLVAGKPSQRSNPWARFWADLELLMEY